MLTWLTRAEMVPCITSANSNFKRCTDILQNFQTDISIPALNGNRRFILY